MDLSTNLLSPPILFFFLGMLAVLIKSDMDIPQTLSKFFSMYLLLAIGFKGGVELSHSEISTEVITTLGLAVITATLAPVYIFFYLKRKVNIYDAGAIAATYGSVSAVTFITATAFLDNLGIDYGGHMVACLALMESPAIIVGVMLIKKYKADGKQQEQASLQEVFKEALTNSSVVLVLGSLLIGMMSGDRGASALSPFTDDIFKGMLSFFLLDMGLLAAKRIGSLKKAGITLLSFSIVLPVLHGILAVALSALFGISSGDALLFSVLFASGSYIAVPAAFRLAVPEANPGLFVPMSLALTFPFNIILGIPFYYYLITTFVTI
ncbi:MAG: sodium-dependent bicarbonate transport family permease [Cyclobacteriaceae bacterium]